MAPTRTEEMKPRVPCPQCDKTFSRKYDMTRHVKGIHDRFRYYCTEPGCPFDAAQKSALVTHMTKHNGKRPNVCPECLTTYKDPSSLSRHKKEQHGHIPHHTASWHARQSRKNARASPYDVSAPGARGTARAKRTAAASEASSSSASSGYVSLPSSSSSVGFGFSLPIPPPVSSDLDTSDFASFPTPPLTYDSSPSSSSADSAFSLPSPSSISPGFDTSDFSSFPASSVALTNLPNLKEEASPFDVSSSISGDALQNLAMPQCPSYLVQDAKDRYEAVPADGDWAAFVQQHMSADYYGLQTPALSMQDCTGYPDDANSQMSYDAGAFDPTWSFAGASASYNQQSQYSSPQPFYEDAAVFQPTPEFYAGAVPEPTLSYDLSPFEQLGAVPTQEQYAPPQVEQPEPADTFAELDPLANVSHEQMALWLKLMTQSQQSAWLGFP